MAWRPPSAAGRLASLWLCVSLSAVPVAGGGEAGVHWPSFRGPRATGVAEGYPTPTRWDVEAGVNVRWRIEIPGLAHSSPVVWGDRLFLTSALRDGEEARLKVGLYGDVESVEEPGVHRWRVYAVDKRTGAVLWQRTAHEGVPRVKRHLKSSHANPTPAIDGERLIVFFGSEGLYAYDLDGSPRWRKDLGVLDSGFFVAPTAQWGFASSPVLHRGKVIVQCDVQQDSFIAAFDARDGRELWRRPRDELPTWSTPTVVERSGGDQIVVNGFRHIGGYDPDTGRELWRMRGGGDIPVPTPVAGHGLVFITNSHGGESPIYAVRSTASGELSAAGGRKSSDLAWSRDRDGAYLPTPLVYGDYLYILRDNGVLGCYAARTGEEIYRQRLGRGVSGFSASPVAADGKIYLTSELGDVYVIKAGPVFELLATNPLGEIAMATPAISEGVLYFRTRGHLVAIAEER